MNVLLALQLLKFVFNFKFGIWQPHVAFIFKFHSEIVVEFDPIYFNFEPVMDLDFVFYQFPTKHSVSAAVLKSAAQ